MPSERLPMRKIREVLRLRFASELSQRAIASSLGLSQGAVCEYLDRARRAGDRGTPLTPEHDAAAQGVRFCAIVHFPTACRRVAGNEWRQSLSADRFLKFDARCSRWSSRPAHIGQWTRLTPTGPMVDAVPRSSGGKSPSAHSSHIPALRRPSNKCSL
jgi:hypothetical protein